TGNMATADAGSAAVLLNNGKVLIAHSHALGPATAELYDPVTGTFSSTGNQLATPFGSQTAALLPDGRVLLVICCGADQLYDPASGRSSLTDTTTGINEDGFAAATLADGTVLLSGGVSEETGIFASGAELYNPSSRSFRPPGNMPTGRAYHTATSLSD